MTDEQRKAYAFTLIGREVERLMNGGPLPCTKRDDPEKLIVAAACYEREPEHRTGEFIEVCWPFHPVLWEPTYKRGYDGRIAELAKAGGLYWAARIVCHSDNLKDRMSKKIDEVRQKIVVEMLEKEALCAAETQSQ